MARNLIITAVNESGTLLGGSSSSLAARSSLDAASPMGASRHKLFAGPLQSARHPEADRLLAKAALLLRLSTLIMEAEGEAMYVLQTVPPLLARVLGSKHCQLAITSKTSKRLVAWVPASAEETHDDDSESSGAGAANAAAPGATGHRLLMRVPVPLDDEITEAVRRALESVDMPGRDSSPQAAPAPDPAGGAAARAPLVPLMTASGGSDLLRARRMMVFTHAREHRLVVPLLATGGSVATAGGTLPVPGAESAAGPAGPSPLAGERVVRTSPRPSAQRSSKSSSIALDGSAASLVSTTVSTSLSTNLSSLAPPLTPAALAPEDVTTAAVAAAGVASGPATPNKRRSRSIASDQTVAAALASGRLLGVLQFRRRIAFSPAELDLVDGAGLQLVFFFQRSRRPKPGASPAMVRASIVRPAPTGTV